MLEHYMLIAYPLSSVISIFIQSTDRRRWEINKSKVTEEFLYIYFYPISFLDFEVLIDSNMKSPGRSG
jgi:hypothetical protein